MSVATIPPDAPFLQTLAYAVSSGTLAHVMGIAPAPETPLHRWTILLPTRRAIPVLRNLFHQQGLSRAHIPRIETLGDFDAMAAGEATPAEPLAISPMGREFLLIALISQWAEANPHWPLARELKGNALRMAGLAQSLAELADRLDTGETSLAGLSTLEDHELSRHWEAVLEILSILSRDLPAALVKMNRIGPLQLRALRTRAMAQSLVGRGIGAPVVAAGSTGTIPATAALLATLAHEAGGVVVLPGLDQEMGEASWEAVSDTHPQIAMKVLLAKMGLSRAQVTPLAKPGPRARLASEIMRPTDAAEGWQPLVREGAAQIAEGLAPVEIIEAPNRRLEAMAIALALREALEVPGRTAALITPDRTLARAVRNALTRWNIDLEDTGGIPLSRTPWGAFLGAVAGVLAEPHAPVALASLLEQSLLAAPAGAAAALRLAVLHRGRAQGLAGLIEACRTSRNQVAEGARVHAAIARLTPQEWDELTALAERLETALTLSGPHMAASEFASRATGLADPALLAASSGTEEVTALLEEMNRHGPDLGDARLATFLDLFGMQLARSTLAAPASGHPRLKIYGLLEARFMAPDWVVLGGLNEGVWPRQQQTGPWLNRSMRKHVGLDVPERQIGLEAQDFVHGFCGGSRVFLSFSRRIDNAPALASRWVLRLQLLRKGAGIGDGHQDRIALAQALDRPDQVTPATTPAPAPPVPLRPRNFSVSAVDQLIRDPYALYAKRILGLNPLEPLEEPADAARRGLILHEILQRHAQGGDWWNLEKLLATGHDVFGQAGLESAALAIWTPRFERMARWITTSQDVFDDAILSLETELEGRMAFVLGGERHSLSARADRIDRLADGAVRIIDYKTGTVPSITPGTKNFSAQLTLEAAIVAAGGFARVTAGSGLEASHIALKADGVTGEGEVKSYGGVKLAERISTDLDGLKALLTAYANPAQVYLPRPRGDEGSDPLDYDHLSRFAEWSMEPGDPVDEPCNPVDEPCDPVGEPGSIRGEPGDDI